MSKFCSVPLIPPAAIPAVRVGAGCRAAPLPLAPAIIQQERCAAVMALKAGLAFLLAYFGLFAVIVLPAIANEAPGKYPGLWRFVHAAPKWVTPGAACEINLETHEQWLLADDAVHQLVDATLAATDTGVAASAPGPIADRGLIRGFKGRNGEAELFRVLGGAGATRSDAARATGWNDATTQE
jgi:hypothetical protein